MMTSFRIGTWLRFLVMFLVLIVASTASAGDDLVAKVGGVPVTKFEVQRELQKLLPLNVGFHGDVPQEKKLEIRNKAIDSLIEQAYKVQYAQASGIAENKMEVDKQFETVRAKFKSKKEFEKALGGEKPKDFRAALSRAFLAKKAEEVAVGSKVKVTDAQIKEYFEKNKATYKRPKQYKASHILVKVDPASSKDEVAVLSKKADDLAKKARAGEDFYNLAYYNSDDRSRYVGGDLGYFHEGQTAKEFEDALKKLKPGEIGGPVRTMWGFHVIKLVELNESRQLEFDEVKDKIRTSLEEKQRQALYDEWMVSLKGKYKVQRFDN